MLLQKKITCGSSHRAKIFPTSWIRPTSWNQSEEEQTPQVLHRSHMTSLHPVFLQGTFVWVCLPDAFSRLKSVKRVWEVHVRIRLVNQLVQRHDGVHHAHLSAVAAAPFRVLQRWEMSLHISHFRWFKEKIHHLVNFQIKNSKHQSTSVHG